MSLKQIMGDFLDLLARDAQATIDSEYYEMAKSTESTHVSLKKAILESRANPVVTEIKAASPSKGSVKKQVNAAEIAKAMEKGGAAAISVLTEPVHFNGSLESLAQARRAVKLPILMKDIILSPLQIAVASKMGADAILLIKALFDRGYSQKTLNEMILGAHVLGLEVLLETHSAFEFGSVLKTDADLIGINNRDLRTLNVNLNTTNRILAKNKSKDKLVISESGINTSADIRFLRKSGASAFLIGSAIMLAENVEEKVKELANA
jgi:indole-3-glycerol phosphate synthase